jgi:hypothetical protein
MLIRRSRVSRRRRVSKSMKRKHHLGQEIPLINESQGHRRGAQHTSRMLVRSMMKVYLWTRKSI